MANESESSRESASEGSDRRTREGPGRSSSSSWSTSPRSICTPMHSSAWRPSFVGAIPARRPESRRVRSRARMQWPDPGSRTLGADHGVRAGRGMARQGFSFHRVGQYLGAPVRVERLRQMKSKRSCLQSLPGWTAWSWSSRSTLWPANRPIDLDRTGRAGRSFSGRRLRARPVAPE